MCSTDEPRPRLSLICGTISETKDTVVTVRCRNAAMAFVSVLCSGCDSHVAGFGKRPVQNFIPFLKSSRYPQEVRFSLGEDELSATTGTES